MDFRSEPNIRVGILGAADTTYRLDGEFEQSLLLSGAKLLTPVSAGATFTLPRVKIGIGFHWERFEPQSFRGALEVNPGGPMVNVIGVEDYLRSVISSEMNAAAPVEFLKAHAIVSRSWLLAMLRRAGAEGECGASAHTLVLDNPEYGCREITRWYDREAHSGFDVCADDHCQRYQGVTRAVSDAVAEAVESTRGMALTYGGEVCDARFSKCCGGMTEEFSAAWEDADVPYIAAVADRPAGSCGDDGCYCATTDRELLSSILNSYDLDSPGFFRWRETVDPELIRRRVMEGCGIDTGTVRELLPLSRGRSGRITRLLIRGEKESVIIGKELEIRRMLSASHLKSSNFTISPAASGSFILDGRGWGHGVGLCQIGAAVMAREGADHISILKHYFKDAEISRLYR